MKVGFKISVFEVNSDGKRKRMGRAIEIRSFKPFDVGQSGNVIGRHMRLVAEYFGITIPAADPKPDPVEGFAPEGSDVTIMGGGKAKK